GDAMYRTIVVSPNETTRFCAAAGISLHPKAVQRQAADASFLLENAAGQGVARCSLWWRRTPMFDGQTIGYLGHYAVSDPAAAPLLFDVALARLVAERRTLAVGPIDGSTWQR